jgi:hypothetical protein
MTTAKCTFRFEFERPELPPPPAEEEDLTLAEQVRRTYAAGRGIYSKSPRVECDLCADCLESFTGWFTEFDDPETGELVGPSQ